MYKSFFWSEVFRYKQVLYIVDQKKLELDEGILLGYYLRLQGTGQRPGFSIDHNIFCRKFPSIPPKVWKPKEVTCAVYWNVCCPSLEFNAGYTTCVVAGLWPTLVKSLVLLNTAGQVTPDYTSLTYKKVSFFYFYSYRVNASILI